MAAFTDYFKVFTGFQFPVGSSSGGGGGGAVAIADITDWPAGVVAAEVGYLDGVTSAIQTQLTAKAPLASPSFTGTVTSPVTNMGSGSRLVMSADGTAAAGSVPFLYRYDSNNPWVFNIPSGLNYQFQVNLTANIMLGTLGIAFYAVNTFTGVGYQVGRAATSLALCAPAGSTISNYIGGNSYLDVGSTKLTAAVPIELSTNGLGASGNMYFARDVNGPAINIGAGVTFQVMSASVLSMGVSPAYGLVFYVDQAISAGSYHILRTANGIVSHAPAAKSNRLMAEPTSVGTSFTTVGTVSGVTQGQIKCSVQGKGTITMDWDGTTLTKSSGAASLVVAGSAGAGETAFRVSGTSIQAIVDTGTRNVSTPAIFHH